jgi:diadenosine tetraphosphatase ApaH/serine/threonine PP2A family protein phosphatase
MRVLVVSDIHSNYAALQAVLDDAGAWDIIWSLGDIVGYGPEPNECIARLNEYPHLAIPGNHDWGVLGKIDLADFNAEARLANLWTREKLTAGSRAYLEALPETRVEGDVTLAHGSPRRPIWEYLIYEGDARTNFKYFRTTLCLVGHTHVPVKFRYDAETDDCEAEAPDEGGTLLGPARYIINPGSVGQPRDGDPRAAYMFIDTDRGSVEHRRVTYEITATQKKMRSAGLPNHLVARLDVGW